MEPDFHLVKALSMQDGHSSISLEYQESNDRPVKARVMLFDKIYYEGGPATAYIEFNKLLKSYLSRKRPGAPVPSVLKLNASDVVDARKHRRAQEVASG